MAKQIEKTRSIPKSAQAVSSRNWKASILWALVVVGVFVAISATVNPIFGRSVHWDWMAGVAPVELAAFVVVLRRRWI